TLPRIPPHNHVHGSPLRVVSCPRRLIAGQRRAASRIPRPSRALDLIPGLAAWLRWTSTCPNEMVTRPGPTLALTAPRSWHTMRRDSAGETGVDVLRDDNGRRRVVIERVRPEI